MYYEFRHDPLHHIACIESKEGISWIGLPKKIKNHFSSDRSCRVGVVDRGPDYEDLTKRYVLATHLRNYIIEKNLGNGLRIFILTDGLNWTSVASEPFVTHTNDILSLHWDPIHEKYFVILSHWYDRNTDHQTVNFISVLYWKKYSI